MHKSLTYAFSVFMSSSITLRNFWASDIGWDFGCITGLAPAGSNISWAMRQKCVTCSALCNTTSLLSSTHIAVVRSNHTGTDGNLYRAIIQLTVAAQTSIYQHRDPSVSVRRDLIYLQISIPTRFIINVISFQATFNFCSVIHWSTNIVISYTVAWAQATYTE